MKIRWETHPALRRLLPQMAHRVMAGYLRTCPGEVLASNETRALMDSGGAILYTMWHGQLLYPLYFFSRRYQQPVILTSPSRDGEFTAEMAQGWGYAICRGSQGKGGIKGLQEMAAYLRRGHSGGLMADGSRGPAHVAQKGLLFLAREGRVPILPLAVASRRKLTFPTWDLFELPLPLSRVALLLGKPLEVPPTARGPGLEPLRLELEARLNHLFRLSQHYFP
jgi:hypothetical protein